MSTTTQQNSATVSTTRLREFLRVDAATRVNVIPVLIGLAVICVVFSLLNDRFLSPANLTNLVLQIVGIGTMAIGIVLVLLIGEIDLSIGSVSGLTAVVMAIANVQHGVPAGLAIILALALGAVVGLLHGLLIAGLGVPSFVVTLGGLIGWQGLQLAILGDAGSLNLNDQFITNLTSLFFPSWIGWVIVVLVIAAVGARAWRQRSVRNRMDLAVAPVWTDVARVAILAAAAIVSMLAFGSNRGVPLSGLILLGLVVVMDFVCTRTLFGRRVYAVGGDAQAASRVGTNVTKVKIIVFTLASVFAVIGGILSASRVMSVSQSSGGGEVLLNVIAAAVIGGTSLYGGRGSIWSALLGALIIGSISNGMDLLGLASPIKFMITGLVLVAAVTFDSVMRNRKSRR